MFEPVIRQLCQFEPVTFNRLGNLTFGQVSPSLGMARKPYSKPIDGSHLQLRELRVKAGLTQEELAERLDTTAVTIGRYETGERDLKITKLLQIADALDCPPSALITNGDGLTAEERDLISFLRANPIHRKILLSQLDVLKETMPPVAAE